MCATTERIGICVMRVAGLLLLAFVVGTFGSCLDTCPLNPEVTEGPYYVDLQLLRSDLRENHDGIPLYLEITVVNSNDCNVVPGAGVEIWHCDAAGIYSHFEEASMNVQGAQTDNTTYLRGIQVADADGAVSFSTIYPGWYTGRALHVHLKVHQGGSTGAVIHTGQLFFEESLNNAIAAQSPYSAKTTARLANADDDIYNSGGYYGLITTWNYVSADDVTQGVQASVRVEVNAKTTTASSSTPTPLASGVLAPSRTPAESPTPSRSYNGAISRSPSHSPFPTASPMNHGQRPDLSPGFYGYDSSEASLVYYSMALLATIFLLL